MTIFTTTSYPIASLVTKIDMGEIGLPELQRPFVWKNTSVRDLFDSLYKGYPTGFLLFWETGAGASVKVIGDAKSPLAASLAIVDGQQRLTSLYAVLKGAEVLRSDFKRERIRIAFSPLLERFAVADAANAKDPTYIADVTELWLPGTKLLKVIGAFKANLAEAGRELTAVEDDRVDEAIQRLHALPGSYRFSALTLAPTSDPATVADVFVRINGKGQKLNQADFILTLMSVHWDEGRARLEAFARAATKPSEGKPSPFNHFIKPSPDQLLRVTVAVALKRARLEGVYAALRGADARTGLEDPAKREEQFDLMRDAQAAVLDLTNWHDFLGSLALAGYRGTKMITSEQAIINAYALYLIGWREHGVPRPALRQAIAEFFFMAALTGRYSASPESRLEADLARLCDPSARGAYLDRLRDLSRTVLTPDYWSISLPETLVSSGSRTPALMAYTASLVVLDARALFSQLKVATLTDPGPNAPKFPVERHHLFPRAYLEASGERDIKRINQIANFGLVEWPVNIQIGKQPPSAYAPPLDHALSGARRDEAYFWHALRPLWWEMPYDDFLRDRRERMARVVEAAWKRLTGEQGDAVAAPPSVDELIRSGETDAVEFKSTLRTNLHTGQPDDKMHLAVLKTVAAFLNARGGTLLIGVADDGSVLGLGADGFPSEDRMGLHLMNLVRDRIGEVVLPYVHPRFEDRGDGRVLVVRCEAGPREAFVKDGAAQRFFVRGGNATAELTGGSMSDYVRRRFG